MTRKKFDDPSADSWFPDQCLSVETALKGYFAHAGWGSKKEDLFGSVQSGKLADLTVLSHDPFAVPIDRIKDIEIEMTIVDGMIAFEK